MGASLELAEKVLPAPLLRALRHVFSQRLSGCVLAGGSALAGFYAGHRRSDDLDFFTASEESQEAAILAVGSLDRIGAAVQVRQHSASYFRALCRLDERRFTVDVALAPGWFQNLRPVMLAGGIAVADLDSLLRMKAAALVSRCAEKDLYDLIWILERCTGMTLPLLVEAARTLDAGADPESLLISVTGARLSPESCDFSLEPAVTRQAVFRRISLFKDELARGLAALAKDEPPPPLADLIAKVRRLSGT